MIIRSGKRSSICSSLIKKFHESQVDGEGAPATPKPDDADTKLFEDSLPHDSGSPGGDIGLDEEQRQADDAAMVVVNQEEKENMSFSHDPNEMEVADLFMDDHDAAMDTQAPESAMIDALRGAGVIETYATAAAHRLCSLQPPVSFMEIYGRSISDYAGAHRRDLNVQGLGAFDLRTTSTPRFGKSQPWRRCVRCPIIYW